MEKASHTASGTPPPGRNEEGPVSAPRCRAWGTANRHEPPTEAGAASLGQPGAGAAMAYLGKKAEATLAARLALGGWALTRAEPGDGYIAARWGRRTEVLADLAAVAMFADRVGAPS
jgi:hypothetical protein